MAAQQKAAQDKAAADAAAVAAGVQRDNDYKDLENKRLAQQNTQRILMMLRQQGMGQQQRGVQALRANLAQRGLLDSGGLGAGLTRISNDTGSMLAAGTQAAARDENSTLMSLMESSRNREHMSREAELSRQQQRRMQELAMQWQAMQAMYQQQNAQKQKSSDAMSGLFNIGTQYGLNYLLPGAGAVTGSLPGASSW